jgi:hypothetical protein
MAEVLAGQPLGLGGGVEALVEHPGVLANRLDQRQPPEVGIHRHACSGGLSAHHGGGSVGDLDASHAPTILGRPARRTARRWYVFS